MKKEFIMSEEERTVKRKKIEENRMKKSKHSRTNRKINNSKQLIQLLNGSSGSNQPIRKSEIKSEAESSFSDSDVTTSPLDNSSEGFHENPAVTASLNKEITINNLQPTAPEPRSNTRPFILIFIVSQILKIKIGRTLELSPPEVVEHPGDNSPAAINGTLRSQSTINVVDPFNINLETMDALLNTAIRAEYNVVVDLVRGNDNSPLSPVRDRQLNEVEAAKLQELVVANIALLAPLTEERPVDVLHIFINIITFLLIDFRFNLYSFTTVPVTQHYWTLSIWPISP